MKKMKIQRVIKVTTVSAVVGVALLGAGFWVVRDKDRIATDIQRLKMTLSIARAVSSKLDFNEGFVMVTRAGKASGRKIELPTLKRVEVEGQSESVRVLFKSVLFSDAIRIEKKAVDPNSALVSNPGNAVR